MMMMMMIYYLLMILLFFNAFKKTSSIDGSFNAIFSIWILFWKRKFTVDNKMFWGLFEVIENVYSVFSIFSISIEFADNFWK